MMRLKLDNERAPGLCDIARCVEASTVIDSTGKLAEGRVELCDKHLKEKHIEDEYQWFERKYRDVADDEVALGHLKALTGGVQ